MFPLRNLWRRPVRTALTVLGVTLSMALTVTMFSIGDGIRSSTDNILTEGDIDLFVLSEGGNLLLGTSYFEDGTMMATDIDNMSHVSHAFPVLYEILYISKAVAPKDTEAITDLSVAGIIPQTIDGFTGSDITSVQHRHTFAGDTLSTKDDPFRDDPAYGLPFSKDGLSSSNFTHEISINKPVARKLGIAVGDTVFLSTTQQFIESAVVPFQVVSITEPVYEFPGQKAADVHLSELQYLERLTNDTVNRVLVNLKDPDDADAVKNVIEDRFEVTVFTQKDFFNTINDFTKVFESFSNMILVVTVSVSLLFISTILVISVRERSKELGALRAMGISRGTILKSVMTESFVISLIGYGLGLIMGFAMSSGLEWFIKATQPGIPTSADLAVIQPLMLLHMMALALFIGTTAGLVPAYWVSKLNIRDVLRDEGGME